MRMTYNGIDLKLLFNLSPYLLELKNMIGLENIKEEIVNMIIYLMTMNTVYEENILKNVLEEDDDDIIKSTSGRDLSKISDMMHTVITGSPGCGKTTFIEILAKIYKNLGILKYGHIVKVKRSDLIGKYLGHTAVQTQKKINEAFGGILLIDEAYSLGNAEGRDSFSKECLDTLNQALSENKSEFICIIAGYKGSLDSCFFGYNEGLNRRFPFRFNIEKYTSDELAMILLKKMEEYRRWDIVVKKVELFDIIKKNEKYFINQGGDMETLFLNIKICQNKRVFLKIVEEKNKLLLEDINNGIKKFIKLSNVEIKDESYLYGLYV
jgi:SpoVK/Ycf46/Vps4 family AAA+-type ATPase